MGPWGGERRKEDRCRARLKAMKPKLYSLHGLDSNHPWSHFTGIDFEKFSHNRIRKVDHYLVYVSGRLPLTNSSSREFIPNLFSSCWHTVVAHTRKQLRSLSTWPHYGSALTLIYADLHCSQRQQSCTQNSCVTEKLAVSWLPTPA